MLDLEFAALNTEEAEQGLLGCLLVRPEAWHAVAGKVRPEDFYNPVHGRIFAKITACVESGSLPSAITLKPFFEMDADLEQVGRTRYLAHLVAHVTTVYNAPHYAETIQAMAARRRFIALCRTAIASASDPNEEFAPVLAELSSEIGKLAAIGNSLVDQRTMAAQVIDELLNSTDCDPTGIRVLDEQGMRGGLYRGRTYAIAAAAKAGKTTLAHSISYNLNHAGVKHGYLALEMGGGQITQRQIARKGRFNSLQFMENKTAEFATHATESSLDLPNNCLFLHRPNLTFSELKTELSQAVMTQGIHGYFLDYWQLVRGKERGQTQEEHQADIAQWCAGFNAKHNVWGVIICQLNKEDNAFGGAGINRACDQFYKLFRSETAGCEHQAWLDLEHSRYTFSGTFGSEISPSLEQVTSAGPYFRDFGSYDL